MKQKNYWKYIVIALISFVVIFHIGAIFYLLTQQTYEVTSLDYYEKGQAYEQEIQAMNRGYKFDWDIKFKNDGHVVIAVTPKEGAELSQELNQISMSCMRPNDSRMDTEITLQRQDTSLVFSTVHGLRSGRWNVRVHFNRNGEEILHRAKIVF